MGSSAPQLIEWKESYYVGFERFDREHVELMELANRVIEAIHGRAPDATVNSAFNTLLDRTCRHFDDEEALMASSHYGHLREHRANHNELVRNLSSFAADCRQGKVDAPRASQFLMDWLLEHVLQADVYYAPYFKERGLT